jgi:hypothetical protein
MNEAYLAYAAVTSDEAHRSIWTFTMLSLFFPLKFFFVMPILKANDGQHLLT